jgi:hypothetical protein
MPLRMVSYKFDVIACLKSCKRKCMIFRKSFATFLEGPVVIIGIHIRKEALGDLPRRVPDSAISIGLDNENL